MAKKGTPSEPAKPVTLPRFEDVLGSGDTYRQRQRALFPGKGRRTIDALTKVKAVYVECGRDRLLARSFEQFLEDFFSPRGDRPDEGSIFFVTGESGAGKSEAVARLLREHPVLQPIETTVGRILPCVSVSLTGYTLPRLVGRQIVAASGYPIRHDVLRGEVWASMAPRLKERGTFLVHVDETQHLIKRGASEDERDELCNSIKGTVADRRGPVAFVLSGLPRLTQLPICDEQVEHRGRHVRFSDVVMPAERKLVLRIMREMTGSIGMDVEALVGPDCDVPERLARAAKYRYGRICKMVLWAIHEALNADLPTGTLTRDHFARAYDAHSQAFGDDNANLFLADDWRVRKSGLYLKDDLVEG